MGTLIDLHSTVPSENWDEDFEFHASPNNDKCVPLSSHQARVSTTSSTLTEDWDKDADISPLHNSRPSEMTSTQFQPENPDFHLANWAEFGPSTPKKQLFSSSTENWDDDFEDRTDSPARKPPGIKISSKASQGVTTSPSRSHFESESWDDEFDLASPGSPSKPKTSTNINDHPPSEHDDDEDEDMDFNFHDKDEDRTVTARSKRNTLPRLSASNETAPFNTTPPPPVPPLPMSLLNSNNSSTALHFPRSPTASVFSAPSVNSGRNSVAYSYYHNNSTTYLRPTVSRQSASGFGNLPPSPPIHKERERRRLRKKSRPDPASVELNFREPLSIRSVNASTESVGMRANRNGRPTTPQTPPHSSSPSLPPSDDTSHTPPIGNRNSTSLNLGPSSPPNKTPLLSRIGSVKKWGVRKKRASSTPSEMMLQDTAADTSITESSYPRSPSKSSGWFSRVTNGGGPSFDIGKRISVGPPAGDHAEEESGTSKFTLTPKAKKVNSASASTSEDVSAKLVKRKSSGFMPLRRNKGPLNDNSVMHDAGELPSDLEQELGLESDTALGRSPSKRKKPVTTQHTRQMAGRHNPSYGGLGLGRAGKTYESSSEDLTEKEPMRSRVKSFSRVKGKSKEPPEEKEGHRNFMGNVRRISLLGGHKRTKSGVSLVSVEEIGKAPPPMAQRNYSEDEPMNVDSESQSASRTPSRSSGLLPPIELQPPSPPRFASDETIGRTAASSSANIDTLLSPPSASSQSLSLSLKKAPGSPQAASLGRSTVVPAIVGSSVVRDNNVPRRNSLGDLKIPARISQAQVGLRRDLGMVREFAANVEQLKELQLLYVTLVTEVQGVLDAYAQQASARTTSPIFFGLARSRSRGRSNSSSAQGGGQQPPQQAYKQLAAAFYTINSKYKIAWECADLLIELGTGSTGASPPSTSVSVPTMSTTFTNEGKKSRERAITLSGEDSKPPTPLPGQMSSSQGAGPPIASPPNIAWRASTGRHDLNHRQLSLLREMLNNPDTSHVIDPQHLPSPAESYPVNRDWRWGEAMNSTVTLPSEESSAQAGSINGDTSSKKRRTSKLIGMSGLRDMLRLLKRSQVEQPPVPTSSTSLSTESSMDSSGSHRYPHGKIPTYGRRRAKTSSGPELARAGSPYNVSASLSAKQSPRRPSLTSIFRMVQKNKQTTPSSTQNPSTVDLSAEDLHDHYRHTRETSGSPGEGDDDWDHVSDIDHNGVKTREFPTIRGRSPYLQDAHLPSNLSNRPQTPKTQRSSSASHSQTSLQREGLPPSIGVPSRTNRLSNVEETVEYKPPQVNVVAGKTASDSFRPPSRSKVGSKTGSVRSMPPQPLGGLPDAKLAMTPENIRPLLENSREVHARLTECIAEIRQLLAVD